MLVPAKKKAHPPHVEPEGLALLQPPPKKTRSSYRSLGDSKTEGLHQVQLGDELRPCFTASPSIEMAKPQDVQGHSEEGSKPGTLIAIKLEDTPMDVVPFVQASGDPVDPMVVDTEKRKMLEMVLPVMGSKDANEGDSFCSKDEPSQAFGTAASLVHDDDVTSALKAAGALLSRKYGIHESEFSMMDVFKEFCNCISKQECEQVNNVEVSVTGTSQQEILNSSTGKNGTDANIDQQKTLILCPEVSESPYLNVPYDSEDSSNIVPVGACSETKETVEVLKHQGLSLVPFVCPFENNQASSIARKYSTDDISRGEEKLKVAIVNETSLNPLLPLFKYSGSNLVAIPVEIENPDHHYYHLAFFTKRRTEALEELTWDYGIHFDDDHHHQLPLSEPVFPWLETSKHFLSSCQYIEAEKPVGLLFCCDNSNNPVDILLTLEWPYENENSFCDTEIRLVNLIEV
ncbi:hypothetical protein Droror1_Dr00000991 [Drosera rotundifolia]